ncbi:MAG: hypothetical protein WBW33_37065 [Bryobacteraceae bacterium]
MAKYNKTGIQARFEGKYQQFVCAYLVAPSVSQAAKQVGVARSTGERWARSEDFKATVDEARRNGVNVLMARLVEAGGKAIDALLSAMSDESTRVAAAGKILDTFARLAAANQTTVNVSQTNQVAVATGKDDADKAREYILSALDKLNHQHVAVEEPVFHAPEVKALAPVIEAEFETVAQAQPVVEAQPVVAPQPVVAQPGPQPEPAPAPQPEPMTITPGPAMAAAGHDGVPGKIGSFDEFSFRDGMIFRN